MKRFSLLGLDDVLCGLLSAGQRRRVGLLRLLMSEASLWILDEPLVALDSAGVDVLMDCFSEHLDKGRQIVMTSHQEIPLLGHACQDYHL
jgi:heme exporter protein A